jgi:hypothetical protein
MKLNQETQTHFMAFFGAKVDGISSMQVHPFDPCATHESSIDVGGVGVQSSATPGRARRFRRRMAFNAEETRHHFAIEALEKPGSFRPQPYLYTCVRCRWIFRLNDSRGSIIALDGLGRRLAEPENSKRIVTFHRGPCPAFPVLEYLATEAERESRLPGFISKIVDMLRGLADRHRSGTRRQESTGNLSTRYASRADA